MADAYVTVDWSGEQGCIEEDEEENEDEVGTKVDEVVEKGEEEEEEEDGVEGVGIEAKAGDETAREIAGDGVGGSAATPGDEKEVEEEGKEEEEEEEQIWAEAGRGVAGSREQGESRVEENR